MKVKVKDIAKAAGVSSSTVSLVLNNRPSRIAEETKENIIRIARELRFQQEMGADFKEQKRARVLGMVVPEGDNPFFQRLSGEVCRFAGQKGYVVFQCQPGNEIESFYQSLRALIEKGVDGLIVIPPETMDKENVKTLKSLQRSGPPMVLLDRAAYTVFCDFVTSDNKLGGRIATEYLLERGHRRIGCMVGGENVYTSRKRVNGYREALSAAGVAFDGGLVYYGSYSSQSGYEGAGDLLKQGVTAIMAGSDQMARGVLEYAEKQGIEVPEKLSLIGYDNTPLCGYLSVPLTSVEQSGDMMAEKAVEILLQRIETWDEDEEEPCRNYYFTPSITERESVAEREDTAEQK